MNPWLVAGASDTTHEPATRTAVTVTGAVNVPAACNISASSSLLPPPPLELAAPPL